MTILEWRIPKMGTIVPKLRTQRGFLPFTGYIVLGTGLIVLVLGIALKVQTERLRSVKAEYESFKTQVRVVGEAQEARTKAEVKRQQEVTKNVEADYSKRLTKLRADYARLRDSRSSGRDLSGLSIPPASVDAIPADAIPLAAICAETTEQLVSLQEWVKGQASKPGAPSP